MVHPYQHSDHYPLIVTWFSKRNMPIPSPESLARVGFVVDETAIGFLIQTDTPLAYIDNYVVDPGANEHQRDSAISILTQTLEAEAKRLGFKTIAAYVGADKMQTRFQDSEFQKLGTYSLMFKQVQ